MKRGGDRSLSCTICPLFIYNIHFWEIHYTENFRGGDFPFPLGKVNFLDIFKNNQKLS